MNKTIFITGTSSGLGKRTALHFAKLGWNVAATLRTPEKETELTQHKNIKLFKLDVTNLDQVQESIAQAIAHFGKIDVVVNNAGMGSYGPLEFATEETIDWQFQVNVRGPINIIRGFLPHFRENGGGMFINISSFMGVTTAVPLGSLYNMSKFALEGLVEGLYYELKPMNIELRLIEQGGSKDTNFKESVIWNKNDKVKDYNHHIQKLTALFDNPNPEMLDDLQVIADAIHDLATGKNTQFRTLVGATAHNLLQLRRSVPIEEYLKTMAANFN